MRLCLIQKKPQDQVAELLMPERLKHTQVTKPEGTLAPPDPSGGDGITVLENQYIPAFRVQMIRTAAEDRFANRKDRGKIGAGSEPFTLDHKILL
jgi:hypothetical protein